MKNQKGITLVALVITIIVLLILAGVSISLVVGQNGVLTQASNAVSTQNEASAKQEIEMAAAACYTEYMTAWAQNGTSDRAAYFTKNKMDANMNNGTVSTPTVESNKGSYEYTLKTNPNNLSGGKLSFTIDYSTGKVEY